MNYKQLLILRLSHLTKWLNETEMIIPEEMRKDFDWNETCEFLGDGKHILRRYWKNGQLYRKKEYQNGQPHGFSLGWWENGQRWYKTKYQNGQRHGLTSGWRDNGRLSWKIKYRNDHRHGLSLGWYENGQPSWKIEYRNDLKHGLDLGWWENGHLWWKKEWQNGKMIKEYIYELQTITYTQTF